jgi:diaminopimelate decarboxylase
MPLLLRGLPRRPAAAASLPARRDNGHLAATGSIERYLVGAYCIERELLIWRRMCFPHGVAVDDVVVFPNTAGYFMHLLESSAHQIPLAANLVVGPYDPPVLDAIDQANRR